MKPLSLCIVLQATNIAGLGILSTSSTVYNKFNIKIQCHILIMYYNKNSDKAHKEVNALFSSA